MKIGIGAAVDHLVPTTDRRDQVCHWQPCDLRQTLDRVSSLHPLHQLRVGKDFPLDDVGVIPVRAGDEELRASSGVEDGPIGRGILSEHGGHLKLGIGLTVPYKPLALCIDPNRETIEGVHAAMASRITRVHESCRVEQLVIKLGELCARIPGELKSTSERVESRSKQDSGAAG